MVRTRKSRARARSMAGTLVMACAGGLLMPGAILASCIAVPTPSGTFAALSRELESDPAAAVRDVNHWISEGMPSELESTELYTIEASGYDLLDDDVRARQAIESARRHLGGISDANARFALNFHLQLVQADTLSGSADIRESLVSLNQLEAAVPARSLNRACLLILRSRLNYEVARDEESTADALAAHQLAEILNAPDVAAYAAFQLAKSYADYGLLADAERMAEEVTAYHRSSGSVALLSYDLYESADVHARMRQFDNALSELAEARSINLSLQRDIDVAMDDERRCAIEVTMQEVGPARQSCRLADAPLRLAGRTDLLADVTDHLAYADLLQRRPRAALDRLNAALLTSPEKVPSRTLAELYRHRASAYAGLGRAPEALSDMEKVSLLQASGVAEAQDVKADRVRTRLRAMVFQQEQALMAAELRTQQAAAERQKRSLQVRISMAIAMGLAGCAVAYVNWIRVRQERTRRQQRETLLKELHHRVKNNMQVICSLLSLQSRAVGENDVRTFSEYSQGRIRSMALVHEQLYRSPRLDRVGMQAYLASLVQNISQAQSLGGVIRCEVTAGQLVLSTDQAATCGLIVNEIITNALKHAFLGAASGLISISLAQQDGGLVELVIADNGVGFESKGSVGPQGFGMQLLEMLVSQLEGDLRRVSGGTGTEFRLTFRGAA
jgi:two-component sensor histidine kinase